jgi:hypothetical protein
VSSYCKPNPSSNGRICDVMAVYAGRFSLLHAHGGPSDGGLLPFGGTASAAALSQPEKLSPIMDSTLYLPACGS